MKTKKLKIISISNTKEMIWMGLESGDKALSYLNKIFGEEDVWDIYDKVYQNSGVTLKKGFYDKFTKKDNVRIIKESKNSAAYIILTKNSIELILKKIKKHKKIKDKIFNYFEFEEKKQNGKRKYRN